MVRLKFTMFGGNHCGDRKKKTQCTTVEPEIKVWRFKLQTPLKDEPLLDHGTYTENGQ